MSIDAIALLRVPYPNLCKLQDLSPAASVTEAMEQTYPFVPVGIDATACFLGLGFGSEPEDLGAYVRHLAGSALDAHTDARGVLIVPDVAWKGTQSSYEAAVDHFGEAGQWVKQMSEAAAHALLKDKMHAMLGGTGLGGLDSTDGRGGFDTAASQQALELLSGASGGTPEGFAGMLQAAQAMLAQMSPEQRAQIEQVAKTAFAQMGSTTTDDDSNGEPPAR